MRCVGNGVVDGAGTAGVWIEDGIHWYVAGERDYVEKGRDSVGEHGKGVGMLGY